jgi:hypothetical protein
MRVSVAVPLDVAVVLVVWVATTWRLVVVLEQRARRARPRPQPVVRRTNPRTPIVASTTTDTAIAPR